MPGSGVKIVDVVLASDNLWCAIFAPRCAVGVGFEARYRYTVFKNVRGDEGIAWMELVMSAMGISKNGIFFIMNLVVWLLKSSNIGTFILLEAMHANGFCGKWPSVA